LKFILWEIVNDIGDIGAALHKNEKNNVNIKMESVRYDEVGCLPFVMVKGFSLLN